MTYRHITSSLIRFVAIVCLILSATPLLHAKTIVTRDGVSVTNEVARSSTAPYERTVTPTDDGVVISYKFHYFNADSTAEGYRLSLPQFGDVSREGAPALLRGRDVVDCPRNATPSLKVHRVNYADIQLSIAPSLPLYSDNGEPTFSPTNPITSYGGFLPSEFVSGLSHQKSRHESIVLTDICPFTYSMRDSTLRLCTELVYEIAFNTPAVATPSDLSGAQDPTCPEVNPGGEVVLIPDSENYMPALPQVDANQKFLIITIPDYADNRDNAPLQRFVRWKRIQGYHTHVALSSSWTPESILDTIKAHYATVPDLHYILFVGNHSAVPAMTFVERINSLEKTILTDKYYGCMDGDNDENIDIARGRWPITSLEELSSIVDKTIGYERNPPEDPSYYSHATHLAYFEDGYIDGEPMGTSKRRFERTCEEIQNYMESCHNLTVDRLYSAPKAGMQAFPDVYPGPLFWADPDSDTPVSLDTVPSLKGYSWDKSYSQFVESIQQGRVYALYRGHGSKDNWHNAMFYDSIYGIEFTSNHLRTLPEHTNTSVIFSITCETGNFSDDCFANAWLTSRGGATSVIAQSNSAYSGANDHLAIGLFNHLWGGSAIPTALISYDQPRTQEPVVRIGALVDSTLNKIYRSSINLQRYTTMITHCFADPSLMVHTSHPKDIEGIEVTREDSVVSVYTGRFTAFISLYNDLTKETRRIFGNRSSIKCNNPEDIWIYIEKEGYRPFLSEGENLSPEPPINEAPNKIIRIVDNLDQTVTIHYRVNDSVGLPYLIVSNMFSSVKVELDFLHSGDGVITIPVTSGYNTIVLYGTNISEALDYQMILVR